MYPAPRVPDWRVTSDHGRYSQTCCLSPKPVRAPLPVCVVIPAYNRAAHLERCLRSVWAQTTASRRGDSRRRSLHRRNRRSGRVARRTRDSTPSRTGARPPRATRASSPLHLTGWHFSTLTTSGCLTISRTCGSCAVSTRWSEHRFCTALMTLARDRFHGAVRRAAGRARTLRTPSSSTTCSLPALP